MPVKEKYYSVYENDPPLKLKGIRVTPKEIDVLSCALFVKAEKNIANFLGLSHKTVSSHLSSLGKKTNSFSREGLLDFTQRAPEYSWLKNHYVQLSLYVKFKNVLKANAGSPPGSNIPQILLDKTIEKSPFAVQFEHDLRLAGIKLAIPNKKHIRDDSASSELDVNDSIGIQISIVEIPLFSKGDRSGSFLNQSGGGSVSPPTIRVVVKQVNRDAVRFKTADDEHIDFTSKKDYYNSFFQLLQTIMPYEDLSLATRPFKDFYKEMLQNPDPITERLSSPDATTGNIVSVRKFPMNNIGLWGLLVISVGIILTHVLVNCTNVRFDVHVLPVADNHKIGSELLIPTESAFLERPQILAKISKKLEQQSGIKTVAILGLVGMGGVGKTTLARQFGRLSPSALVWEINAETSMTLLNSFIDLAYALANTQESKEELAYIQKIQNAAEKEHQIIYFVKTHLKACPNWLLIYDNVGVLSEISDFFPQNAETWGKGSVIITTRDLNIQNDAFINPEYIVELGELNAQESLKLFSKIRYGMDPDHLNPSQRNEAVEFLNHIPPFPLDVSLAAYYIKDTQISYTEYLAGIVHLDKNFENLQTKIAKASTHYKNARFGIITLPLAKIIEGDADFRDLLLMIALLDSQNIPRDLLEKYKSKSCVDKFIIDLKRFSLVSSASPAVNQLYYAIHRSTQEIIRNWLAGSLDDVLKNQVCDKIYQALDAYTLSITESDVLSQTKSLATHLESVLKHSKTISVSRTESVEGNLGSIYYSFGNYVRAKNMLEGAVKKIGGHYRENPSQCARVFVDLGTVYWDLAQFANAIKCLEEGIYIYKKFLPQEKTARAHALSYLGILLNEFELFERAESTLKESIAIYDEYAPDDKKGIAESLLHMGIVRWSVGRYDESIACYEKVIALFKKHFPGRHALYGWTLVNLGNTYRDAGFYTKAINAYQESLKVYRTHLPENVVEIGRITARMAVAHHELGNDAMARTLLEGAFENYRKQLPESHTGFAWLLARLGNTHIALGNYHEAKKMIEKSLKIYKLTLPDNFIEVARATSYLGDANKHLGQWGEARKNLQQALSIYEKTYGRNHIEPAEIKKKLAEAYGLEGRDIEAERLLNEALWSFAESRHPKQFLVLEALGELYIKKLKNALVVGKRNEALAHKQKALDYLKRALEGMLNNDLKDSAHKERLEKKIQKFTHFD